MITIFGLKIMTIADENRLFEQAKNQALSDLIDLLRRADKIYTQPVTLVGDNQTLNNCVFFGMGEATCLKIEPREIDQQNDLMHLVAEEDIPLGNYVGINPLSGKVVIYTGENSQYLFQTFVDICKGDKIAFNSRSVRIVSIIRDEKEVFTNPFVM